MTMSVTHRCPPMGSNVMPCCGLTPWDVSVRDRISDSSALVNCMGKYSDREKRTEVETDTTTRTEAMECISCGELLHCNNCGSWQPEPKPDPELSRLLFEAREQADMWADVVESRSKQPATHVRDLVERIDNYRTKRGWPIDGYGSNDG